MQSLNIAHFGLRTNDLVRAIDWYRTVTGAQILYRNDMAAFMSFDDEHHRFVLWDDGETSEKSTDGAGVDHIGFGCNGLTGLADHYEHLASKGIRPELAVNDVLP